MNTSRFSVPITLCLALFAVAGTAVAQSYPTKPVKFVVPYAPGGGVDTIARLLSEKLQARLGQPFVVENKPGAGGAIGIEAVAKSAPDGYTAVFVGSGAVTASVHFTKLAYDPVKDLAPITIVQILPIVISVNPAFPAKNVGELIAYVKQRPGAVNYSSNGLGSISFLSAELFKRMAGIDMVHIVYRGAQPGAAAIASGEVQLGFNDSVAVMPLARGGSVRAIAVTDPKRSSIAPDIPTVAESGLPGYAVTAWGGMFAPAGTPPAIIAKLNAEIARALKEPDINERFLRAGMEPATSTPEELGEIVRTELETWGKVIREGNLKVE